MTATTEISVYLLAEMESKIQRQQAEIHILRARLEYETNPALRQARAMQNQGQAMHSQGLIAPFGGQR
jgi:hypothetical protein